MNTYIKDETISLFHAYALTFRHPKTKENYWSMLEQFCNQQQVDLLDATKEHTDSYYVWLQSQVECKKLHYTTMVARWNTLRSLWGELATSSERPITQNPFGSCISLNPSRIRWDQYPSYQTVDILMAAAKDTDARVYAIICLTAVCGLTVSELTNLELTDLIRDANGNLGITLEGRTVKVPTDVMEIVTDYIAKIRPRRYLFETRSHSACSVRTIQHYVKEFLRQQNLPNVTLQGLRQFSMMAMMQNPNANHNEVATYLGLSPSWVRLVEYSLPELTHAAVDEQMFAIRPNYH